MPMHKIFFLNNGWQVNAGQKARVFGTTYLSKMLLGVWNYLSFQNVIGFFSSRRCSFEGFETCYKIAPNFLLILCQRSWTIQTFSPGMHQLGCKRIWARERWLKMRQLNIFLIYLLNFALIEKSDFLILNVYMGKFIYSKFAEF